MKSLYSLLPDREDMEQVADGLTSCGTVLRGVWVFIEGCVGVYWGVCGCLLRGVWVFISLEPQRNKFDYTHGGPEED